LLMQLLGVHAGLKVPGATVVSLATVTIFSTTIYRMGVEAGLKVPGANISRRGSCFLMRLLGVHAGLKVPGAIMSRRGSCLLMQLLGVHAGLKVPLPLLFLLLL
jgi:hypothetical protein